MGKQWLTLFSFGSKITADGDYSHEIKRRLLLGRKVNDQPRQHIKKQRHYFANKYPSSQSYGFSSSPVWMWELDYKESWVPKNWCYWTVVLEKTLESPLDCKEIQPVHPKGDQSWEFIGRTDVEAETPILWPPDAKLTPEKRPWGWERLKVGGEGDDRGWDGWMASLTQWTWVWINSRSSWWTGRPGVLQSMGLQTVRHNWAAELNWTRLFRCILSVIFTALDQFLQGMQQLAEWKRLLTEDQGDLPGGASGKQHACQCKRHGFDPWVRKIPWRRA